MLNKGMNQKNDVLLYFYFYTNIFIYRFSVCCSDQTIKDSQKAILERIDAIDGDGEDNATPDEITTLTTQEEFDRKETKLWYIAYCRRNVNFELLDL